MKYLKLIRVHQWIKNIFVFLPIFFSGNFLQIDLLLKSIVGFILFSLTASSIYIINDYVDIEADKNHPDKKNRPLASGSIKKNTALLLLVILILASVGLTYYFANLKVGIILGTYFMMNIAYSFGLKKIAIIDITIIAIGFLMRVLVGGYITGITISDWTILLTFTLALILAIGKRRGEIINSERNGKTRKSLEGYNLPFLNIALGVLCAITIVCYIMYSLSPSVQERIHHYVLYTFIFVFIGILRYLQQTLVFERTESPTKMIYKDYFLQITLILWGVSFALLIYFK